MTAPDVLLLAFSISTLVICLLLRRATNRHARRAEEAARQSEAAARRAEEARQRADAARATMRLARNRSTPKGN